MADEVSSAAPAAIDVRRLREALGTRSVVLVGLMGAGKSSVGRRLAQRLGLPFVDADTEIEKAADLTIPEIFDKHGEAYFRAGEVRVVARILDTGPQVLATGGGAYMNAETRARIRERGISIWLKAELDVLMKRVKRRGDRPLLKADDPQAVLKRLMDERYPVYAEAALTVLSREATHEDAVEDVLRALACHLLPPAERALP
ncbi:shikimate kinase [Phreatobacter sp.]|uniref:shikimate kinase n=1 Tax=Phreatobacter sp. TaxID=1966341 RepID=UPI0025D359D7|nr:shikimate kinase [Phreatobacter sp.]